MMRRVTVSISENDYQRLSGLAEESGVSISWVFRYAVQELIQRYGEGHQFPLPIERRARTRRESQS
jgi:metal-responsive CopG/Arc/MetJ family transcriptional regulator